MTKKPSSTSPSPILPLFYKQVVPLNKEVHGELYVEGIEDYLHTKDTNSIYIAAVEFLQASREYPIVFAKGKDDVVFPVALLGLEQNQNVFIDKSGAWTANYIPAYVRRYPFILATADDTKDNIASLKDQIQRLKLELENEKNKVTKPEPNPDTGEVPLRTGVAHAILDKKGPKPDAAKVKKEKVKLSSGQSKIEVNPNVDIGQISGGNKASTGNLH